MINLVVGLAIGLIFIFSHSAVGKTNQQQRLPLYSANQCTVALKRETDVLERQIQANSFTVDRDLRRYGIFLGKAFLDLLNIKIAEGLEFHWMDVGAGEANAIYDFLQSWESRNSRDFNRLSLTAVSAGAPNINIAYIRHRFAFEENSEAFRYLVGKIEHETRVPLATQDLVTDTYGACTYSPQLSEVMAKVGSVLKPGGRFVAHIPLGGIRIENSKGEKIDVLDWFGKIRGLEIEKSERFVYDDGTHIRLILKRTQGPIEIPGLTITHLLAPQGAIPRRVFRIDSSQDHLFTVQTIPDGGDLPFLLMGDPNWFNNQDQVKDILAKATLWFKKDYLVYLSDYLMKAYPEIERHVMVSLRQTVQFVANLAMLATESDLEQRILAARAYLKTNIVPASTESGSITEAFLHPETSEKAKIEIMRLATRGPVLPPEIFGTYFLMLASENPKLAVAILSEVTLHQSWSVFEAGTARQACVILANNSNPQIYAFIPRWFTIYSHVGINPATREKLRSLIDELGKILRNKPEQGVRKATMEMLKV